jgi:hypothetical protein
MNNKIFAAWAVAAGMALAAPIPAATAADVKDEAVGTKETLKEKAVDTKDTLKEKAVELKDKIKDKTAATKEKVKAKLDKDDGNPPTVSSERHHGSINNFRDVQTALKAKGFDPGPIDGVYGPRTNAAIQDFQRSENLMVTGRLDRETTTRLAGLSGRSDSGVEPSASPLTTTAPTSDPQPLPRRQRLP